MKDVKQDTTEMIFDEDKFVDGECVYKAGQPYHVANASVERWLKRGGKILSEEEAKKKKSSTKDEATKTALKTGAEEVEKIKEQIALMNVKDLKAALVEEGMEAKDVSGLKKEELVELLTKKTIGEQE